MNMCVRPIVLTRPDLERLQNMLQSQFAITVGEGRPHIAELKEVLANAEIVESPDIQADIITMNSTIKLLDLDTNDSETFTLVYPIEACIAEGKLSILSPLGAQLLGRRVTEELSFSVMDRRTRKKVARIWFQPERMGAFSL